MKIEDLNLSALKYFIDAVEMESISLSSQINHVSRPAVSQAILRLGDWFGQPLLKHEKRNFVLTPAGKEFYQRAKLSYQSIQQSFLEKQEESDSLKFGCSASLFELTIPHLEKYLKKSQKPVVKFGTTDQLFESLRNGEINLAFAMDKGSVREFKSQAVHSGAFHVLSKTGRFHETLITTEPRKETESLDRYFHRKKISFQSHIRAESWTMAVQLASLNLGCCLVPDFIHAPHLKVVATPGWKEKYTVSIYIRKLHELSSLENELVSSLPLHGK